MKVNKMLELKNAIGKILQSKNQTFPKEITFSKGLEYPKYRIVIEEIEDDFFIDAKGQRWKKVKNSEQDDE